MKTLETQTDSVIDSLSQAEIERAARSWITEFGQVLVEDRIESGVRLFAEGAYWRDVLGFTWDWRTFRGFNEIRASLSGPVEQAAVTDFGPLEAQRPTLQPPVADVPGVIRAGFEFSTKFGRCRGQAQLIWQNGAWRARTIYTELTTIHGHEPIATRSDGFRDTKYRQAQRGRALVSTEQERRTEFVDEDPAVLVIGGGHIGLQMAARLERLGIPTLVAEQDERIGNRWRNRYEGLFLHSTIFTDHFPFMPYPANWPLFPSKNDVADWLEIYANAMRLRVWTSTQVRAAEFDEQRQAWDVTIVRKGQERRVTVSQIVVSIGVFGDPIIPQIPGRESFTGEVLHAARFSGTPEGLEGKRVVVVGAATTAMDIAQHSYEVGASSVTMIQRGPTYVMRPSTGFPVMYADFLDKDAGDIEERNFQIRANPNRQLLDSVLKHTTQLIAEKDKEQLESLARAGFGVYLGPTDAGVTELALERAGGYYFDKGCLQLIIDGDVAVKRGTIDHYTQSGIRLSDGTDIDADIVIFATGYTSVKDAVRPIFGADLTTSISPIWGLDQEGEIQGVYRPSGVPRLWFTAGGFQEAARFGGPLALQIQATELGVVNK